MQFCTECGEKLPSSARFCSSCGQAVQAETSPPRQEPGQPPGWDPQFGTPQGPGHSQPGYPHPTHSQPAHPQPGYPPPGYPSSGYAPAVGYPHQGFAQQGPARPGPVLAPLDPPLLARDLGAALLLLTSLATPWFRWGGAGEHSVPATVFTVIALFACAVSYVLPLVFGTRPNSQTLLAIKGALVAPLVVLGIIALVQHLRQEEVAGPAVAIALVGAVLTLQTADQERTAAVLWRNTTLVLTGISVLVALLWFILTVRRFGAVTSAFEDVTRLMMLPVLGLIVAFVVAGAIAVATVTGRPFAAGLALAGAAALAVLGLGTLFSADAGGGLLLVSVGNPEFILQFMALAAMAAPVLLRRIPQLGGQQGWVVATSRFALVTAIMWAFGFLLNVIVLLVLYTGTQTPGSMGLLIWMLTLQVLAALGFAIVHRTISTDLSQGRMVALVVAGLLSVAAVVTWAVSEGSTEVTSGPFAILVFCLVLVGLVTIPPVMRATPMQALGGAGRFGRSAGSYPGQPYPGGRNPGQYQPGPQPGGQYPTGQYPGGSGVGGQQGGPDSPGSGPVPTQPPSGSEQQAPAEPDAPDTGETVVRPEHRPDGPTPHEDDSWHPRPER